LLPGVAPKSDEFVVAEVMVNGRLPLLVTVRVWLPEALTFWLPKLTVAVESVMAVPRPVPESDTVCDEPVALSAMEIWAERAPMAVGVKVTVRVQTAPTARLGPQLLEAKSPGLPPVIEKELMERAAVPVLVMVRVWAGLVAPTFWETKLRLGAERVTAGEGAPPVPFRVTDWGEAGALSENKTFVVRRPAAVGVNVTVTVHVAPTARVEAQVLVKLKSPGLLPLRVMEERVMGSTPLLVRVMGFGVLAVPTGWPPKVRVVGEKEVVGVAFSMAMVWPPRWMYSLEGVVGPELWAREREMEARRRGRRVVE